MTGPAPSPPAPESVPAIALRGLSKSYGKVEAVRDLSLEVRQGEVFGFLGLNGAGKTTTIRVLLDLLRPSRGSAELFGRDCQRESARTRAWVGYLPGELGLQTDVGGDALLTLLGRLSGGAVRPAYLDELLARLEFPRADLRRRIREYSVGMKRKLGLLQALQTDPPLLILDEPTEGLDPLMQRALHEILFDLRRRGRTVFMSSHVLSEIERVCDRLAVIRNGELALLATVEEVRRLGGRTVRVHFEREVEGIELPAGMSFHSRTAVRWEIRSPGPVGALLPRLTGLPVRDLEVVEPALEDVLRGFYREERP